MEGYSAFSDFYKKLIGHVQSDIFKTSSFKKQNKIPLVTSGIVILRCIPGFVRTRDKLANKVKSEPYNFYLINKLKMQKCSKLNC